MMRTIAPSALRFAALVGLVCTLLRWAIPVHASDEASAPAPGSADALFTNRALPRIQIEIPPEGIAVLRNYEWEWGGNSWARTNVLGTVREGNRVYTNVAIHLKGGAGSFRSVDQKPALTLNFDKFADGQRFDGLQKIHLNNSVQDPSYLCEQISRELFLAAGVPTPRAANATVVLNGRALGLYVLVEGWNKQFLKRHFKNTKGNLWDGGFAKEITAPLELNSGEHPDDRSALDALVKAANQPDLTQRWGELEKTLDLDRFLTFIALEVMLAHWDGYALNRNNYRVFHDLDSDRIVFLPHGMDQMFGVWRARPESSITPQLRGLVARAVVQTPEGRRRFLNRMSQLLTNVFKVEVLTNRVNELADRIRPALAARPAEAVGQERALAQLRDRIVRRERSVREQLAVATAPLPFDRSGVAKLTQWESNRDSGNPSFDRTHIPRDILQITASGGQAYGSWRTIVLLEEGEYRFEGRVKTQDLVLGRNVTRGGVTLRMAGERAATMHPVVSEWTPISYDFKVSGITDVELVCELRAASGWAWFEVDSLRLIRKNRL